MVIYTCLFVVLFYFMDVQGAALSRLPSASSGGPAQATSATPRRLCMPHGRRHAQICKVLDQRVLPVVDLQQLVCSYDCDISLLNSAAGGALWRGSFLKSLGIPQPELHMSSNPMLDTTGCVNVWREAWSIAPSTTESLTWRSKVEVPKIIGCALARENGEHKLFVRRAAGSDCVLIPHKEGTTGQVLGSTPVSQAVFDAQIQANRQDKTLLYYHGTPATVVMVDSRARMRQFDTRRVPLAPHTERVLLYTDYVVYLFERDRLKKFTWDQLTAFHGAALYNKKLASSDLSVTLGMS